MARAPAMQSPVSVRFGRGEAPVLKVVNARARAQGRSVSEQIKFYIRLAVVAEDNPDLPLGFVRDALEGAEESKAGLSVPYQWGVLK